MDTHIALWSVWDSERLPQQARDMLENRQNVIYYSLVSVWEIAIKHAINPSNMPMPEERFCELCDLTGFVQLPIKANHIYAVKELIRPEGAPAHKDPFDRLLIAQAKTEDFTFLTHDSLLPYYKERCIVCC